MGTHNFRGEFKPQLRITTTLPVEVQRLAHSKAIKWSEALEAGVNKLAFMEAPPCFLWRNRRKSHRIK